MNSALEALRNAQKKQNSYIEFEIEGIPAKINIAQWEDILVQQNLVESELRRELRKRYENKPFDRQQWIEDRKREALNEIELLKKEKPTKEINQLIDEKNKTLALLETNAPKDFSEFATRIISGFVFYRAVIPFILNENNETMFPDKEADEAIKLIEGNLSARRAINDAFNELLERNKKARDLVKN